MKQKYENSQKMLQMTAFLDPRFKNCRFLNAQQFIELKCHIQGEINTNNDVKQIKSNLSASHTILWNDYEDDYHTIDEVEMYQMCPQLRLQDDPFIFLRNYTLTYPNIYKLKRKYLSIPGSTVPSERVFSTSGYIVDLLRSRLTPEHVEILVFLKCNSCLMD